MQDIFSKNQVFVTSAPGSAFAETRRFLEQTSQLVSYLSYLAALLISIRVFFIFLNMPLIGMTDTIFQITDIFVRPFSYFLTETFFGLEIASFLAISALVGSSLLTQLLINSIKQILERGGEV